MEKLTGHQRAILTMLWIKHGMDGDREDYIKAVCKAKKLQYVPPPVVKRLPE